jgi:hypothetical protein
MQLGAKGIENILTISIIIHYNGVGKKKTPKKLRSFKIKKKNTFPFHS